MHLSEVPSLPLHSDAFWCDTLAGSLGYFAILDPRVFGATPLNHVARKRAPLSGCFVSHFTMS